MTVLVPVFVFMSFKISSSFFLLSDVILSESKAKWMVNFWVFVCICDACCFLGRGICVSCKGVLSWASVSGFTAREPDSLMTRGRMGLRIKESGSGQLSQIRNVLPSENETVLSAG